MAKELEKIPSEKRADYLNKKADNLCKKYGIKCRTVKKEHAHA